MEESNAFKILIATDNHLGYLERDPIRGKDSFETFEEILQIAQLQQVDFVVLGGDLFHHNRPSIASLYKAMDLLKTYCLGEKPSKVWIASDPNATFADVPNYLNPNLNISLPIYSIHGNHDDPSGTDNLCPLNLLSTAGLMNYFGQNTNVEGVAVQPILMQKGSSKLALYGLGSMREERLHRLWRANKVKFLRPEEEEWKGCFNMFVFHQNRARHGPTSHIPEEFIDGFLDLILWGHEHECRIYPEQYERFAITQPGSSVATSLTQGEAEPKHVGLLTIEGEDFKLEKIRLRTIRPFQFTDVKLSAVENLPRTDTKRIQTYLEGVVEDLIERAKIEWSEYTNSEQDPQTIMPIPLIRIRVDYSGGYDTFNPQLLGQKFIKRVANPKDILKFQKNTQSYLKKPSEMISDLATALPERLDSVRVEDLASEMLSRRLQMLSEPKFKETLLSSIQKSDKSAFSNYFTESVAQFRETVSLNPEETSDEYVKRKALEAKERINAAYDSQSEVLPFTGLSDNSRSMSVDDVVAPTLEERGNTNDDNPSLDEILERGCRREAPEPSPPSTRSKRRALPSVLNRRK
ncbi:Metallo-dependent phosphatase-like protein [Sporodiniella umbellata]|nr:Metallo-dependent phosphatase-like protein [Sporodiniella umbellata]